MASHGSRSAASTFVGLRSPCSSTVGLAARGRVRIVCERRADRALGRRAGAGRAVPPARRPRRRAPRPGSAGRPGSERRAVGHRARLRPAPRRPSHLVEQAAPGRHRSKSSARRPGRRRKPRTAPSPSQARSPAASGSDSGCGSCSFRTASRPSWRRRARRHPRDVAAGLERRPQLEVPGGSTSATRTGAARRARAGPASPSQATTVAASFVGIASTATAPVPRAMRPG